MIQLAKRLGLGNFGDEDHEGLVGANSISVGGAEDVSLVTLIKSGKALAGEIVDRGIGRILNVAAGIGEVVGVNALDLDVLENGDSAGPLNGIARAARSGGLCPSHRPHGACGEQRRSHHAGQSGRCSLLEQDRAVSEKRYRAACFARSVGRCAYR